jgi:hypothetical protein
MFTFVAPASRLFSSSSFTTAAGRSTTSPAAIWLTSWVGMAWIRFDEVRSDVIKIYYYSIVNELILSGLACLFSTYMLDMPVSPGMLAETSLSHDRGYFSIT